MQCLKNDNVLHIPEAQYKTTITNTTFLKKMFGAMRFTYYINRSTATNVD